MTLRRWCVQKEKLLYCMLRCPLARRKEKPSASSLIIARSQFSLFTVRVIGAGLPTEGERDGFADARHAPESGDEMLPASILFVVDDSVTGFPRAFSKRCASHKTSCPLGQVGSDCYDSSRWPWCRTGRPCQAAHTIVYYHFVSAIH